MIMHLMHFFFFFNDTATTEIYTLSLHDALPIFIRIASIYRVWRLEAIVLQATRARAIGDRDSKSKSGKDEDRNSVRHQPGRRFSAVESYILRCGYPERPRTPGWPSLHRKYTKDR